MLFKIKRFFEEILYRYRKRKSLKQAAEQDRNIYTLW